MSKLTKGELWQFGGLWLEANIGLIARLEDYIEGTDTYYWIIVHWYIEERLKQALS